MIIFLSFYNRRDILWLHSAFNDIVISSIHSFFSQVNRRSWCFCIVRLMNYWMNLHPVMAGQRTISVQISEACNIISHSKFERNHKAEMNIDLLWVHIQRDVFLSSESASLVQCLASPSIVILYRVVEPSMFVIFSIEMLLTTRSMTLLLHDSHPGPNHQFPFSVFFLVLFVRC